MKILHVSLWPIDKNSIGGTERYVICLASSLDKKGVYNDVAMLSSKKATINGVTYIPINISHSKRLNEYLIKDKFLRSFDEYSLTKLAKDVEKEFDFSKYDIIHFNSLLFYFCAIDKKRIFTIHDDPSGFEQNWGKGSLKVISQIIRDDRLSSTIFVTPSKYYASIYKKAFLKDVVAIPHSINKNFLNARKTNNKNKELTIFSPSRLELKQKGQDILVRSLVKIKNSLPRFNVVFAGLDDQYKPNIKALRKIKGADKINMSFYKIPMNKMVSFYNKSDLIIIPSRYETFGYTALESLCVGKKTVLSNIPTHKEIAKENSLAFLTKNDPTSLGRTILKAIKTERKAQANQEWLKRYSEDKWANNYIKLYKSCLKK